MSRLKDQIINAIIQIEGGYVDNPDDSGGPTMYGITESVARDNGYLGLMSCFPRPLAEKIYSDRYWYSLRLDDIEKLSPRIAEELVDTGVNQGVYRAGEFLQRSLNVFNKKQGIYDDVRVDGRVGNATLRALKAYLEFRGSVGELVLFRALNSLQGAFYVKLTERREKDESFIFGWFLNRVA